MITERQRYVRGVSLSPGKACCYSIPERWIINGRPTGTKREDRPQPSAEEKAAANRRRVISRYWQAVGWLWMRSRQQWIDLPGGRRLRHRQGLLTLTLPGVATADHKAVKARILDPFFTYCRNVLGLRDYVWVAELQERGEIHFHAIVNQFLPKDKVRAAWLRACDASGIISSSGGGSRPATEIEECRSYSGSRSYAGKYMFKALKCGEIIGRVWSGSHSVCKLGSVSTNEVDQAFDAPAALVEVSARAKEWRQYDHGISIARFDLARVTYRHAPVLYRLFRAHIRAFDQPPPSNDHDQQRTDQHAQGHDRTRSISASIPDQRSASGRQVDRRLQAMGRRVQCAGAIAGPGSVHVQATRGDRLLPVQASLWVELGERDMGSVHPVALN